MTDRVCAASATFLVETGTARDPHHFACLIGYGATAVYPYMAYQVLFEMMRKGRVKLDFAARLRARAAATARAMRKGLFKIMSKMGISTISSYRSSQLFEIVGLARRWWSCASPAPRAACRARTSPIWRPTRKLPRRARLEPARPGWSRAGCYKYVHGGEYHMYNPDVIAALQAAVVSGDYALYRQYAQLVNERPGGHLRDLLALKAPAASIPLEEVEPVEAMLARFDSAGMSLGALSPEAHEALAIAMNRLGARSNSGEGGEDPARYGTEKNSKIKQVASGRFGVTPEYLINAEVLQIKIAQGAKPGEGGQLPGHKVNDMIAHLALRAPGRRPDLPAAASRHLLDRGSGAADLRSEAGESAARWCRSSWSPSRVSARSPPASPRRTPISSPSPATTAAPAQARCPPSSTPARPGSSGSPRRTRRCGRMTCATACALQTDGGLKTGLDVVKAAIIGAESFGFGTAPMVALGCKYLRICHLNNCATGVATQHNVLRSKYFIGLPRDGDELLPLRRRGGARDPGLPRGASP